MTTESPPQPLTVRIAVCAVCELLFALHPDRPFSPCHGADPIAVLATVTLRPDGTVAGSFGDAVAAPEAAPVEAPALEEPPTAPALPEEGPEAPPAPEAPLAPEASAEPAGPIEAPAVPEEAPISPLRRAAAALLLGEATIDDLARALADASADRAWTNRLLAMVQDLDEALEAGPPAWGAHVP